MQNIYFEYPKLVYDYDAVYQVINNQIREEINRFIILHNLLVQSPPAKILTRDFVLRHKEMTFEERKVFSYSFTFEEIEEMFRVEREYWVIRNRVPVSIILNDKSICIVSSAEGTLHFRQAEDFIRMCFPEYGREIISRSRQRGRTDLIALFKINQTKVKQNLIIF